jgi:oligopeptide/dipeptide ABC transporter ATP-binding protein
LSVTIEVKGAVGAYGVNGPRVLHEIDLVVEPGSAIGVVGESGSGKTTLARMLVGFLDPVEGSVTVNGQRWKEISRRSPLRGSVQYIFQDPYGSLNPWMTALEAVAEAVEVHDRVSSSAARARATELLASTGLSADAMIRRPERLSGGQCQRVGIARALASRPSIVIADEPTSALDVSVQAQILNLLLELQIQQQIGLVLISHDLGVVRHLTDTTLVIYRGRTLERGPTQAILAAPAHPYTRLLLDTVPGSDSPLETVVNQGEDRHPCVFAGRCPRLAANCVELAITDLNDSHSVLCRHPFVGPSASHGQTQEHGSHVAQ